MFLSFQVRWTAPAEMTPCIDGYQVKASFSHLRILTDNTDNNTNNGNLLYLAKVAWRENLENGEENGFNLENITQPDVFRYVLFRMNAYVRFMNLLNLSLKLTENIRPCVNHDIKVK